MTTMHKNNGDLMKKTMTTTKIDSTTRVENSRVNDMYLIDRYKLF